MKISMEELRELIRKVIKEKQDKERASLPKIKGHIPVQDSSGTIDKESLEQMIRGLTKNREE